MKSEIIANEEKYNEKEYADLAKKISDKFTLVKYEDLINSIVAQKEEEKEVEETKPLRNLANFAITASRDFPIASFTVLGQTVSIKYSVKVTSSTASNKLVITSGLGTFEFGNTGCTAKVSNSKSYNKNILTIPVPGTGARHGGRTRRNLPVPRGGNRPRRQSPLSGISARNLRRGTASPDVSRWPDWHPVYLRGEDHRYQGPGRGFGCHTAF